MRYLSWIILADLLFGPAAMLGIWGSKNASFYLLLLCAFAALACKVRPVGMTFVAALREMWPIAIAMAGPLIATLLHDLANGAFNAKLYDMPSRLALFPLLVWVLLSLPSRRLKTFYLGMAVGSIVGALALFIATHNGNARPAVVFLMPIIPFGNLTFMMGAFALMSVAMDEPRERAVIALKILAGCAGLWAAYLSQTRGAWLVMVVGGCVWLALQKHLSNRRKIGLLCLAILIISGVYVFGDILKSRMLDAYSDLSLYMSGGNPDTSLGIRLQLWRASWIIFERHPFFGIGLNHYVDGLNRLASEGVITPEAATFHHAHNDLLFSMSTLGSVGLLATLCVYIVPAYLFLKARRDPDRQVQIAAEEGFYLAVFFFLFGLTEVMFFYWTSNHGFYSFVMAALFAHVWRRKIETTPSSAMYGKPEAASVVSG